MFVVNGERPLTMIASILIERARVKRRLAAISRAAMVSALVTGCSYVPDALNPVTWYDGIADMVSGDAPPELATPRKAQSQPDNGTAPADAAAKAPSPEGLGADHSHANYAGAVHRDVAPTKPLVRRAAPAEPEVAAAPVAAPATVASSAIVTPAAPVSPPGSVPDVTVQALKAGARADLGPQSPPSQRPNMTPPARPDIPDQVAAAPAPAAQNTVALTPPRGKFALDRQYQNRLNESAGVSVDQSQVTPPSRLVGAEFEPVHLVPPGGRGKGLAAPQPPAPANSFQVATLDFSGVSATLTAQDRKAIAQVVKLYRQTGGIIRIVGLPPQAATADDMVDLERANAVAYELTRQGVPAGKLFVASDYPAADNAGARVFLDY